jgi:hypothetical protein
MADNVGSAATFVIQPGKSMFGGLTGSLRDRDGLGIFLDAVSSGKPYDGVENNVSRGRVGYITVNHTVPHLPGYGFSLSCPPTALGGGINNMPYRAIKLRFLL